MKQGKIKIVFRDADPHYVGVAVTDDVELTDADVWQQIQCWWLAPTLPSRFALALDSGVLLLDRDQVVAIAMTPKPVLEI